MIKNLNVLTFSAYGEILQDRLPNRGFPQNAQWQEMRLTIHRDDEFSLRYESEDIFVDFEHGMAILGVTREGDRELSYFYLDKPVRLFAETGYVILPYNEEATIRFSRDLGSHVCRELILNNAHELRISSELEIDNVYTLFYQEKEKNFFFRGEQHSMFELTYVDKGALHSVVDGVDHLLEQGELMFYGPEQWHMQYADNERSASFITVTFDVDFKDTDLLLNRTFKLGSHTVNILKKLLAETESGCYLTDDMILCNLKEFIIHILRMAIGGQDGTRLETSLSETSSNAIIERALNYMAENVYEKLTVAMVAREVNVSTAYLSTLFKRCLKAPPSEYISKIKLEESKRLIREGKMNFTQISDKLQFGTIHHFSHKFKEKYGVTPTEYARAIR